MGDWLWWSGRRSLDAASRAGGRIAVEIALHVAVAVLDGLAHAYARRDPEGVFGNDFVARHLAGAVD